MATMMYRQLPQALQQPSQQSRARKEIYRYEASFPVYSISWYNNLQVRKKLLVFIEEYSNKVEVIRLDDTTGDFIVSGSFDHPYPATKVLWVPDKDGTYPDLIATSGDYLRLWRVNYDNTVQLECLLNNNRNSDFCAPLTSFDWNEVDLSLIGTSSIDTTCTIWSIETGQPIGSAKASGSLRTQLIAHDKEVYDISFSRLGDGRNSFASVGADGSVRLFDLRQLEHSTIIFEDFNKRSLLRLKWNVQDPNYLVTFAQDSNDVRFSCGEKSYERFQVIILDIRIPCTPVARLNNHKACVNGIAWAPHSSCHLCSVADDKQALIWDISQLPQSVEDPILAYTADGEINYVQWSASQHDWIVITFDNKVEILRV